MQLLYILVSVLIVSVVSLVGAVSLAIKDRLLKRILPGLVAFSAGALIAGAFLHLIPEAIAQSGKGEVFIFVIAGFVFFFVLEKYIHWHHCHKGVCDLHAFTYLNLIGDGVHNFIDGLVIAASFLISFEFGVITTLLIIAHEVPQELGDFGVLVYGGFSKRKALLFNFLTALTAFLGAIAGYFLTNKIAGISYILFSATAGGFLYVASSDLVPEIQKESNPIKSSISLFIFILGIVFMYITKGLSH